MLKDFFKKTMDVVFVNFLWIITSLLGILLTLGAATSAMYKVIYKIIYYDEPTSVFKEFVKGFKENFKPATLTWLILLILAIPLYFMYLYALDHGVDLLVVIAIVGAYQWVIFFIYYFPTISLLKTDHVGQMIKNVLFLANKNLWRNFLVIGSLVFVLILVFYVHPSFLVIAPGLFGFLSAFHLRNMYKPYIEQFEELNEGSVK